MNMFLELVLLFVGLSIATSLLFGRYLHAISKLSPGQLDTRIPQYNVMFITLIVSYLLTVGAILMFMLSMLFTNYPCCN